MHKLFLICLTFFLVLFTGCSAHQPQINTNELLDGNFTSVAGTYTNPDGDTIQLDEDGLRWFEQRTRDVHCTEDGFCSMGIHQKGVPDGGYALNIYPIGMEIEGLDTDTKKVRICYGQAEPMSEKEIYTYTSNKLDPVVIDSEIQAFMMKEYYDVLNECSSPYGLLNPSVEKNEIRFTGPTLESSYDMMEQLYHLTLRHSFTYSKNGVLKTAQLEIRTEASDFFHTDTFGQLVISDGQQFSLSYDDKSMKIIECGSNQLVPFVDELQNQLTALFEDAEIIGKLHAEVLRIWADEIQKVHSSEKTLDSIKNARDIELNTSILENPFHTSMRDYELTDPCAAAIEITQFFMNSRQGAIDFSDIDSSKISNESILWDTINITLFEGNEHFPYTSLIRRSSSMIYIFTFEEMKQYAYELYGIEFEPFIPYEWSSMYNPDLQRYESALEFGLGGEGPDTTFNVANMKAEQDGHYVNVSFDIEWFDKDGDWNKDEEITIWHASSQYLMMTENGHSFLRHIYTDFSD